MGGRLNASYNCVDRHLATSRNQAALRGHLSTPWPTPKVPANLSSEERQVTLDLPVAHEGVPRVKLLALDLRVVVDVITVRRLAEELAARPVWPFSSGPLGTKTTDDKGRDLREVAEPKEIPGFKDAIAPRDHHVFFGALDPRKLSFAERSLRKLPAARAMLPEGDFRDWCARTFSVMMAASFGGEDVGIG